MTSIQSVFSLLLLRHGNTFRPQDRVLWLGAGDDIPLTDLGEAQIRLAAQYMAVKGLSPSVVYCAPAARTYTSARLVRNSCPTVETIKIDARLDELDYGGWIGLTIASLDLRMLVANLARVKQPTGGLNTSTRSETTTGHCHPSRDPSR